jgi:hypothetical protein
MGYGLDSWGSIPGRAWDSSLLHSAQIDSGVHPASYPVGTGTSFPSGKAAGVWSWPLTSTYCQGQEQARYTLSRRYVFMVWCLSN